MKLLSFGVYWVRHSSKGAEVGAFQSSLKGVSSRVRTNNGCEEKRI